MLFIYKLTLELNFKLTLSAKLTKINVFSCDKIFPSKEMQILSQR